MTNILTKTLRSSFLILAFSLFINTASAQNCATPPTCEQLGYTSNSADCAANALKCPFDQSKLFCTDVDLGSLCNTGYILYDDMSCSPKPIVGKSPIGIVFNPSKRLAFSLTYNLTGVWKDNPTTSINLPCTNNIQCYKNGQSNTDVIASKFPSSSVAKKCIDYPGPKAWFLPSFDDLTPFWSSTSRALIDDGLDAINSRSDIGAFTFPTTIWTSNTYGNTSNGMLVNLTNGNISSTSDWRNARGFLMAIQY